MKKDKVRIKQVILGLCVLLAGFCYMASRGYLSGASEPVFQVADESSNADETGNADGTVPSDNGVPGVVSAEKPEVVPAEPREPTVSREIFVHVCGEVKEPGVYSMAEGSRIFEVLLQTGGYTDHAAPDFLNMAQMLADGMKITVPDKETAAQMIKQSQENDGGAFSGPGVWQQGSTQEGSAQQDTAKVNINTAAKEQLMTLKGIGAARAEDIIAYREQSGPFQTIEDIMRVSGIKEAAFQKIKESITV